MLKKNLLRIIGGTRCILFMLIWSFLYRATHKNLYILILFKIDFKINDDLYVYKDKKEI